LVETVRFVFSHTSAAGRQLIRSVQFLVLSGASDRELATTTTSSGGLLKPPGPSQSQDAALIKTPPCALADGKSETNCLEMQLQEMYCHVSMPDLLSLPLLAPSRLRVA
jgi:hypothetical protein